MRWLLDCPERAFKKKLPQPFASVVVFLCLYRAQSGSALRGSGLRDLPRFLLADGLGWVVGRKFISDPTCYRPRVCVVATPPDRVSTPKAFADGMGRMLRGNCRTWLSGGRRPHVDRAEN